jgi:hypothetical protein
MNAGPHRRGTVTNIITRVILGIIVGVWERPVHGHPSDVLLAGGRRDEQARGRLSGRPFRLSAEPGYGVDIVNARRHR